MKDNAKNKKQKTEKGQTMMYKTLRIKIRSTNTKPTNKLD